MEPVDYPGMTARRLPLALLATGLAAGAMAGPADADVTALGPDLTTTGPATVALSDPNDILWWAGEPGVEVTQQGEIRGIRLKGGTVQSAQQRANAKAFDPNYDIMHWVVLRRQGDGTWRAVSASEDVRAPIVGMNGVTASTVSEIRQPQDNYRVCAKPGDRVALASVGGYVPTADGTGQPIAGFQNGLPYQTFAHASGSVTDEFRAGGMVLPDTRIAGSPKDGVQLQMQALLGTGGDARFTCQTPQEQAGAAGGGSGSGGGAASKPLVPMATPLAKARRLSDRNTVPVNLTCRQEGTACSGLITLRAHKKTIGKRSYALQPGQSGVFTLKLTKQGRRFVRVASRGYLRAAIVTTATGGRKAGAIFNIRPARKSKKGKR